MGEVFLAEDTKLERKVALKFYLRSSAPTRRRGSASSQAKAASALDHPTLLGVRDRETLEALFYAMGIRGKDAERAIANASVGQVATFLQQRQIRLPSGRIAVQIAED